ncbi:hypothetical protein COU57_04110 [Candidatus Pacearchaeota archaeon CG10_big_fil_rev_8_21_14_0_10_32_14]|nr:MAG: hypothetical protein COU57_04110 [Candidatus Pacearchaeota archaeon CG10_big_fil_rev_8_21_14_0_10_32_14]
MIKKPRRNKSENMIYAIVGFSLAIMTIIIVNIITEPSFFDLFGLTTFVFLICVGIWILQTDKVPPDWIGFILFLIGVLGLIVDGTIVVRTYLLN